MEEDQINYILQHYQQMTVMQMADHLKVNRKRVYAYLHYRKMIPISPVVTKKKLKLNGKHFDETAHENWLV